MSQKRAITTFLSRKFMITPSSIAFEDFRGSSIAPQVMPPWGGRIYVTRHQPTTKASVTATAHLTSCVPYHPSTNAHPASEPSCSRVAPTMPRYLSICSAAQRSNLNAEARSDMRKWAALVNCLPQAGVLKRVKANQPCWNRKERSFNLQLSGLKGWNQCRATICSSHQGQFRAILRTVVIPWANWASLAS